MDDTRTCLNDTHCKAYDNLAKHAADTPDPLCPDCLDTAERDVRGLVYDYLDLAQLHEASMSQAITEKTAGSKEKTMLLVGNVEALQAEIVHTLSTWEYEIRVAARLSDPYNSAPVADWHTTISHPAPLAKVRPGFAVQRAAGIIAPRMRLLSRLPTTTVCATGIEDDPVDMIGAEAVQHLQALHQRARATLGRTRRTFWVPGECWTCNARPTPGIDGPLCRSEPLKYEDPMQVACDRCHASRPYPDYEQYMATLLWPDAVTDANVRIAA
ncbi:hypothetical protein ACWKSP_26425 [Micromonosporaceae bacterium Da 78-11]